MDLPLCETIVGGPSESASAHHTIWSCIHSLSGVSCSTVSLLSRRRDLDRQQHSRNGDLQSTEDLHADGRRRCCRESPAEARPRRYHVPIRDFLLFGSRRRTGARSSFHWPGQLSCRRSPE